MYNVVGSRHRSGGGPSCGPAPNFRPRFSKQRGESPALAAISAVTFDLWQTLLMDSGDLGRGRAQLRIDGAREALSEVGRDID